MGSLAWLRIYFQVQRGSCAVLWAVFLDDVARLVANSSYHPRTSSIHRYDWECDYSSTCQRLIQALSLFCPPLSAEDCLEAANTGLCQCFGLSKCERGPFGRFATFSFARFLQTTRAPDSQIQIFLRFLTVQEARLLWTRLPFSLVALLRFSLLKIFGFLLWTSFRFQTGHPAGFVLPLPSQPVFCGRCGCLCGTWYILVTSVCSHSKSCHWPLACSFDPNR